jgi:thioredoxin 1
MATVPVTDATFDAEVRQSDIPVVVDFWAEWCGPCKQIGPALEELSAEYDGKVKIVKVNVDENPNSPMQLGVRGIPALFMFKDGEVIGRRCAEGRAAEVDRRGRLSRPSLRERSWKWAPSAAPPGRPRGTPLGFHAVQPLVKLGFHPQLGHVEAFDFRFFADPDAHDGLEDEPDDQAGDEGEDTECRDAREAGSRGRFAVEDDGDGAPDTCEQVDRDGADHVVDLELVEQRNREDHDHAANGADPECANSVGAAARP